MAGVIPNGKIVTDIDINTIKATTSLKDLKQAVQNTTSAWRAQQAELRSAGKASEAAAAKYKGLGEAIDKQKAYISRLKEANVAYQNTLKTSNRSTQEGRKEYNNAATALEKNVRQLNSARTRLASLTGQQEKARTSMNYYKSGLNKLQSEYRTSGNLSKSYVNRLEAEGQHQKANAERAKAYSNAIRNLSSQQKIQDSELNRIAETAGKSSEAYKRQQIRVNETATSLAKAKTQMSNVNSEMRKANPSIFDRIKSKLTGINKTGEQTHRTFKEVFMGSALGNAAVNALSNIGSQLKSVYKDGMQANAIAGKINSRFKNMGESKNAVRALDSQIKSLKYNTGMTGEQVADLQSHMLNWSSIGRKGAMQMTKAVAGIGDSSKLTGEQMERLGQGLMRVGSTGKVTFSSLNRITKGAPTFYRQLAKGAGMSESHLKSLLRSGNVTQKQFQKWMAASAKYSDSAFKKYGTTGGAALHRMQQHWLEIKKIMMKPLFSARNSGLQELSKILASKEIRNGAKAIGNGINSIVNAAYKHRKDITGIAKDVVSIAVELGKSLWKDFAAIIGDIGKAFGLVHGNSSKAGGSLHTVKLAMDGLAKNRTAIQWISKAIIAIAAVKGLAKVSNGIVGITSASYGAYRKVSALRAGLKGIKDIKKFKGAEGAFNSLGLSISKVIPKLKGLLGFKGASAGKFTGMLQSLRSARKAGGLTTAGKIATGAAVAGIAVDSGADIYKAVKAKAGSKKQYEDIGSGAGKAIGGGIGLYFGGPLGAAIGAKIGGAVGKWAGDAAKKFQNGWNAKKPPKKFWSLANLGWSAHSMWNGFTSSVGKTIKWFSKVGKNIQKSWKGMTRWFSKLGRNMAKGLKSAWKGMTKWFSNIGKGIKKSWRSMTSWFRKLGRNMSKGLKSAWHSITSWFSNIAKGVQHGWSGMTHFFSSLGSKTVRVFKSAWHGITSWFKGIVDGIKNAWDGFWSAVSGPIKFMGKLLGGKVKIGSLHLASGTDWRRKYPIPAIVNDGNDSPETNNREGLIDRDGTLKAFPNIRNFKYWLLPGQEVVNARDMAMFGAVRHFAKGTKSLGISRLDGVRGRHGSIASITAELKVLAKQLKLVQRLARRSLDFKFLKKNQKQLNKFTSTFKQLVKADKKLNTETKHSVTNFKNLTRRLNSTIKATEKLYKEAKRSKFGDYIDKQARKAVKSLRGKGNFAKQFKKLTNQFTNSLHKFRSSFKHDWAKLWEDAHKEFEKWTEEQLKNQKKFKNSFEKGFKAIGSGIEKVFRQTWSNMKKLAGKGMNAVIKVLNSGISRVNSVVHQFGGSSSIHHVAGVRYANGTSKVNKPTLAIVNDGSDSPETGNKEAFYRPSTGEFGIFQGRNTQTMLMPGDEVLKASETRDLMHGLGYEHFANGSGGTLHALYELTKKFYKNPSGTLNAMFGTAAKGFRKVMHSIVANAQTVGQNQAQEWWSTLWTMVHKKIDGGGAATGLLKAVENLGRGKKYVWGAWGPSAYDCSGLVSRALQKYYHKSWGRMNVAGLWHHAHRISQSQAKPGDPIFWLPNHHVGIYIGGDRYWSAYAPGAHPDVGVHSIKDSVPGVRPTFGRFYGVSGESHGNSHVKANTPLQRLIRGQVGKGFWRTISKIAEKYGASLGAFGLTGSLRRRACTLYSAMHRLDPRATRNGIAAILGNWVFESGGLNPGAVNSGSGASGLGQWLGGRLSGLKAYARRHHTSWKNPALQLRYAYSGDGANTSIFRSILRGHGSVASLAAQFSNRWERGGHTAQHVAGAEKIVRALGFANGGITNKPAIFGEAGPEMAIPLMPAKSTRAWELIGKAIAILSNQSGIAVNQAQQQQEQKEDHKFRKEIIALLTAIATGQGQTIQTDISIDGRKAWQAMSRYAKQDQRREMNYGRKGFSSGFTI